MANEAIQTRGAYATCIASASVGAGGFSTAGNGSTITQAIASEDDYPLLDFRLQTTAGTVSADDVINLYRRAGDGTNTAPIPSSSNKEEYVGSFVIDTNAEYRYIYGVDNPDPNDEYYIENTGAAAITMVVSVRGRTQGTA